MLKLTPFNRFGITKEPSDDQFFNMIDDFFNDPFTISRNLRHDTFKIDVKELDDKYVVEAEMPGVTKDQIKIDYQDSRLLIAINREDVVKEEKENYVHRERRVSSMQRAIYLKDINSDEMKAKLNDGVLVIEAPKKETTKKSFAIEIE